MAQTTDTADSSRPALVSAKTVVTALCFGVAALLVVTADLYLPIAGTDVVTDPREVFTTIGAALTGPVGGILIGFLAGIREPEIPLASLVAHVSGGLWMGLAYKRLVHERLEMPGLLLGWVALVLVYYFTFAVPGFVIGKAIFYKESIEGCCGAGTLMAAYRALAEGVLTEVIVTSVITSLAILALPRRFRAPLW